MYSSTWNFIRKTLSGLHFAFQHRFTHPVNLNVINGVYSIMYGFWNIMVLKAAQAVSKLLVFSSICMLVIEFGNGNGFCNRLDTQREIHKFD
jgi:succinate dehydrogenase/fumarate reductase cytochrome b subunit